MTSIVLVHGGCAGAWEWQRVRPLLEAEGFDVRVPDLPSVGDAGPLGDMYDDAASVRRLLDGLERPVVLCGHSYGGLVISEASVGPHASVAHLVYLAAVIPAQDETFMSLVTDHSGALDDDDTFEFGDDGTVAFATEPMAKAKIALGWPAAEAQYVASQHRRQSMMVAVQSARGTPWQNLPTTFVRCARDELIPPSMAELFASRAGEVIDLDTDHDPEWTMPDEVCGILMGIARRYC